MDVDRGTSTATRDGGIAVLLKPVEFVAPAALRQVIADFGRTEDICFSPSNRRLAIAGFGRDRVFLLDVLVADGRSGTVTLAVTGITEVQAAGLHDPHGISFLDDDTLVVANRGGEVTILRLPPPVRGSHTVRVTPAATISADAHGLAAPGSVVVSAVAPDLHEVLVCNNAANTVTRHVVDGRRGFRTLGTSVAAAAGLQIPDGVAVSADGHWLAVSSHETHAVLLYRNGPQLGPSSRPDGMLHGLAYPHGLRFTGDGRYLVVADAGAPSIHVFAACGDWSGDRTPIATHQLMDDECFHRGRSNPQEGGPKGLAIDREGRILAVTSEHQPLALFDLRDALPDGRPPGRAGTTPAQAAETARTVLLRELATVTDLRTTAAEQQQRIAEQDEALDHQLRETATLSTALESAQAALVAAHAAIAHERAVADDLARQVDALQCSTSWRATAPARALSERLRRVGRSDGPLAAEPSPPRPAPGPPDGGAGPR